MSETITEEDRKKAESCLNCPVCSHARKTQRGLAFWFVKNVEGGICPACQAYEKVYGRKAHEPIPL
jgi:Zn ribbon nucleic-acid-binding protein